jgi:protein gp37
MGATTKISWCDATFNPWTGCTKVTAECDHCYAEGWAKRSGLVQWGHGNPRRRTSAANWRQPVKWNREAEAACQRRRVFCASLADWADAEVDPAWRADLFDLIRATPMLDWLLLTKRHALARRLLPAEPLPNVRVGMTVGDKSTALLRLPRLAQLGQGGWKTFVSYEPALGPVDWGAYLDPEGIFGGCLHWIICGGESGPKARPMHPDWARALRDQCVAAGVPFFFKQWGEWAPGECADGPPRRTEQTAAWWAGRWQFGRVTLRESEEMHRDDEPDLYRLGTKRAGHLLDGQVWQQFPEPA